MSFKVVVSDVEAWFKKVFKNAPQETASALAVVNEIAPEAEILFALVDPAAAAIVNPIATEVQADLAVVAKTLANGGTASVPAFLSSIQANLASLLSAGHIKDPASVTKATGIVAGIQSMVNDVIAAVEHASTPTAS
jgi:hypothetical protein